MYQIEIKKPNKIKEFWKRLVSKTEDLFFDFLQLLPEKMIPAGIMKWCEGYLDRRIRQMEREHIMQQWNNAYLEKAVKNLKSGS